LAVPLVWEEVRVSTDAWFGVLGIVIGALGVVLAVYFWLRPRPLQPILYWQTVSSVPLLRHPGGLFDGIKITVAGQEIPQATIWTGTIWNAGRAVIRESDLARGGLALHFAGVEVLGTSVVSLSQDESELTLSHSDDAVAVAFQFLNPQERAAIAVLHAGPASVRPELRGVVLGGSIRDAEASRERLDRWAKHFSVFLLGPLAVVAVASVVRPEWLNMTIVWISLVGTFTGLIASLYNVKREFERSRQRWD
jgi:hypothetical protein